MKKDCLGCEQAYLLEASGDETERNRGGKKCFSTSTCKQTKPSSNTSRPHAEKDDGRRLRHVPISRLINIIIINAMERRRVILSIGDIIIDVEQRS